TIPIHASVCPAHAWLRISRNDYLRKAAASPIAIMLLPPTSDLTVRTSKGDIGLMIYPFGLVFRVGPTYYAASTRTIVLAGIFMALAVFLFTGHKFWRRQRV